MRDTVIKRILEIKKSEKDFSPSLGWKNVYFSETDKFGVIISDVDYEKLTDADLCRYFEYIVRMQCDIVRSRVQKQYFPEKYR